MAEALQVSSPYYLYYERFAGKKQEQLIKLIDKIKRERELTEKNMFPTLFTFKALTFHTLNLLQILAFLAASFVFWKRAKEEHYSEVEVFDGYLLSLIFGGLVGRLAFIVFNWSQFGLDVIKWLNIVTYPGTIFLFSLTGAAFYLDRYALKQKWDAFEILDFWAQAVSLALFFLNIGYFLAGIKFGQATNLPWGLVFPGVFEKRHPVQLYLAVFYLGVFKYLGWLEFNYRTFEWYRSGKKTAQTGFLFINLILLTGFIRLVLLPLSLAQFYLGEVALDPWLYLLLLIFGLFLLLKRANRVLFSLKQKRFLAPKRG